MHAPMKYVEKGMSIAANGVWQDAQASADTAHKLEDSILTRARELRLASLGNG